MHFVRGHIICDIVAKQATTPARDIAAAANSTAGRAGVNESADSDSKELEKRPMVTVSGSQTDGGSAVAQASEARGAVKSESTDGVSAAAGRAKRAKRSKKSYDPFEESQRPQWAARQTRVQ